VGVTFADKFLNFSVNFEAFERMAPIPSNTQVIVTFSLADSERQNEDDVHKQLSSNLFATEQSEHCTHFVFCAILNTTQRANNKQK